MQQYEAWSERVETDALNMSEAEILRQAGDTRDYVETTVTLGGQVASRSSESSEEANAGFVKCDIRVDYPITLAVRAVLYTRLVTNASRKE